MSNFSATRMRSIAVKCAALFLLTAVACWLIWFPAGALPRLLVDRCDSQGEPRESAQIVVVGVLTSDTLVRRPVPMQSDRKYPLQLRKLQVKVENVLKGVVDGGNVSIYYFTWAGGFDGPRPLGMWDVGGRRILWLNHDDGVLRTACDGWDSCTWGVYSGAHPDYRVDSQKSISQAVADIALTRGKGEINEKKFAGAVQMGVVGAPVPEEYIAERFGKLAATEHSLVKAAACANLWILAQERGASESLRGTAKAAMRKADCACDTKMGGMCTTPVNIGVDPPW